MNEMAASLKETAGQAESVAASADELVSSVNELAASIEQVDRQHDQPGRVGRRDGAPRSQETPRRSSTVTGDDAGHGDRGAAGRRRRSTEMAGSIEVVSRDTESLDRLGQRDRGGDRGDDAVDQGGVAGNADDLAAAAEETSSSINEMAASIEEVGAMTESLATAVEQNSSVDRTDVALGAGGRAERPADHRRRHATPRPARPQMERSIQSVARSRTQADEVTRRVARDAEEGGATVQRSIQGIGRMRDSMAQSATVMREMGKRTDDITHDRRHHQPDRRAHQPAVAQRLDRSGARRRCRARLRGRRRGDPQPGRSIGEGDRRHRRDHQGAAGSGAGRGAGVERRPARRRREQRAGRDRRGRAQEDPRRRLGEIAGVVGADRARHRGAANRRRSRWSTPVSAASEQARLDGGVDRRAGHRPRRASCRRPAQMREDRAGSDQGGRRAGPRVARHHQGGAGHDALAVAGPQGVAASRPTVAAEITQADRIDAARRGHDVARARPSRPAAPSRSSRLRTRCSARSRR